MSELTTEEIKALPKSRVVQMYLSGSKKGYLVFANIDPFTGLSDGNNSWVWKIRPKVPLLRLGPGSTWNVPFVSEDGAKRYYLGSAEYAGHIEDDERRAVWWATHRAHELKWRLETEHSKAMKDDRLKATLKPIRDAYIDLSWRDRNVLLAHIITYITGGL